MDQEQSEDDFIRDSICSVCNSTKKLYVVHTRLGWYNWCCPKCNEEEYYAKWPTDEAKEIIKKLADNVTEAKRLEKDFLKAYEANPMKAVENYKKL